MIIVCVGLSRLVEFPLNLKDCHLLLLNYLFILILEGLRSYQTEPLHHLIELFEFYHSIPKLSKWSHFLKHLNRFRGFILITHLLQGGLFSFHFNLLLYNLNGPFITLYLTEAFKDICNIFNHIPLNVNTLNFKHFSKGNQINMSSGDHFTIFIAELHDYFLLSLLHLLTEWCSLLCGHSNKFLKCSLEWTQIKPRWGFKFIVFLIIILFRLLTSLFGLLSWFAE